MPAWKVPVLVQAVGTAAPLSYGVTRPRSRDRLVVASLVVRWSYLCANGPVRLVPLSVLCVMLTTCRMLSILCGGLAPYYLARLVSLCSVLLSLLIGLGLGCCGLCLTLCGMGLGPDLKSSLDASSGGCGCPD